MIKIMDYEQKYKKALGWMRSLYTGLHGKTREEAETYFPELKESEDEKIRKAIYNALKYLETEQSWDFLDDVDILDVYAWLEKQGEKSWSKEDKDYLNCVIATMEEDAKLPPYTIKKLCNWLKSLGNRIQPQQEWSEEDKSFIEDINNVIIENYNILQSDKEKMIDWLKSIKPKHWKPSEEQMKAIKYFIDFHRPQANASTEGWEEFKNLESLYNGLKKL